jgi:hypothetical protein
MTNTGTKIEIQENSNRPHRTFRAMGKDKFTEPFGQCQKAQLHQIPPWSLSTLRRLGMTDDKIAAYFSTWKNKSESASNIVNFD